MTANYTIQKYDYDTRKTTTDATFVHYECARRYFEELCAHLQGVMDTTESWVFYVASGNYNCNFKLLKLD